MNADPYLARLALVFSVFAFALALLALLVATR